MIPKATRIALATTALAAAVSAHAQTTGEGLENFRLRPTAPNIQGPTTPDNPIIERPAPQPQPSQPPKAAPPVSKPETPKAETPKAPPAKAETAKTAAPRTNEAKPANASRQEPVRPHTPTTGQPAPKPAADANKPVADAKSGQVPPAPAPTAPPVAVNPAPTPAAPQPTPQAAPSQPQVAPAQPAAAALPPLPGESATNGKPWWLYPALALLLLCIVIGGLLFWRKRRDQAQFDTIMAIERPRLQPAEGGTTQVQPPIPAPEPESLPEPAAATVAPEVATAPAAPAAQKPPTVNDHASPPLGCMLETTSLSVSLVNATLAYQVTLANASNEPIRNLAIFGDLVSAHASVPMDEQLAGPGAASAPLHRLPELPAGQTISFNGQLRLPLNAIRAVRSEQAVMFIPLARMRVEAEGLPKAVIQTCVIGQKPNGPGAGLRPFRLDTGPRIYPDIGQRALDVPTPQAA